MRIIDAQNMEMSLKDESDDSRELNEDQDEYIDE
jgi:hypothetical protein